jgi:hypothetical protein
MLYSFHFHQRNLAGPASIRNIVAEAVLVRYGKERVIFLHDAAVLWDDWQDLVMYQDPVFKHPFWPKFWQEVLEVCERVNEGATKSDAYNLPAEVRSAPLLTKSNLLLAVKIVRRHHT